MPSPGVTVLVGAAVLVLAISTNYHHYCTDALPISPGVFNKGDPNQRCSASKSGKCLSSPSNSWERGCESNMHCRSPPSGREEEPTAESLPALDLHHGPDDDVDNGVDDEDIDEDVDDRQHVDDDGIKDVTETA